MLDEAEKVGGILKSPPDSVRNISEFAKKEFCWTGHVKGRAGIPTERVLQFGIDLQEFSDGVRLGAREGRLNREVDFDVAIVALMPRALEIAEVAVAKGLASPKNTSALRKLSTGNLNLNKGEKNALEALLDRLEISY
jgi:hypothetical protein